MVREEMEMKLLEKLEKGQLDGIVGHDFVRGNGITHRTIIMDGVPWLTSTLGLPKNVEILNTSLRYIVATGNPKITIVIRSLARKSLPDLRSGRLAFIQLLLALISCQF